MIKKSINERKIRAGQREIMDCDFPTTKEEVKGEEVHLGGGITKWIPFTGMKD